MPKWLVKLKGEEFDLEAIARLLRSPSLNVTKEEDGYYLRSAAFDHLTDPSEIGEQAALILRRASAVERIRCGSSLPLERDVVYQVQADGSRRDFLDVELQFSWDVRAPHVPATSDEVSRFSATVNRAETDPKIDKALRLLITRETTWSTTLYNILEVVLEDVGGTVWRSGWASESEVRRFKQTSKSPAVLGDEARHGRERTDPPKDPMTLADADTLVRQILREWLRLKVSGLSDDRGIPGPY